MAADRNRLHALVDALPETDVEVAISFLAELGEEEIVDTETAAKLDRARAETGGDVPLEEVRRRLGMWSVVSSSVRPPSAIWNVWIESFRHGLMRLSCVTP
jgi:hypothetical protein